MTTPQPSCANWPDDLFTRTDPDSHAYAKAVCERCPAIEWCRKEVVKVEHPVGTWATKLFIERNGHKARLATCVVCSAEFLANHALTKVCGEECRRTRTLHNQRARAGVRG